jgi:hypothetical protein
MNRQEIQKRHDECSCGGKMLGIISADDKGNKYVIDDPEKVQAHTDRGYLLAKLAASIEESETDYRMRREAEARLAKVDKASQFSYMSINDGNLAEHGYVAVKLEKIIALEEALKC